MLCVCVCLCVLEHSLQHSRHEQLSNVVSDRRNDNADVDEIVRVIAAVKKVDVAVCPT